MIWYFLGLRARPTLCNDIPPVFSRVKLIFFSLLEPPAETDDNLELNSNNIVFMTQTPSGTGSDNSETDGEVAIPMLAVEEDVVNVEADVGTPKLVEEDVDTKEADSETLGLAVENEVIETDIAYIPEIDVEENVDIEEVDVSVPQLPGGWFYFRKSGASPLYQTFQTFPGWKSGYQRMPWHYPRRWPARPIRPRLNNEVGDETNGYNTKLSPSYHPFYAFRKISH